MAKKDKKEEEEKVEIIINCLNEPSEEAIKNLNREYLKIVMEMFKDGRLD